MVVLVAAEGCLVWRLGSSRHSVVPVAVVDVMRLPLWPPKHACVLLPWHAAASRVCCNPLKCGLLWISRLDFYAQLLQTQVLMQCLGLRNRHAQLLSCGDMVGKPWRWPSYH